MSSVYCGDVSAHSTPGKFVVFCVGQEPERIESFKAWARKNGLPFKEVLGSYKGSREHSFVVSLTTFRRLREWVKEEESYLLLDEANHLGWRNAKLVYRSGREEHLGRWRGVSEGEALSQDSWTYDPYSKTYYICF